MCKVKFPNGIVKRLPRDTTTPLVDRFNGDFLFHLYSVHGIDPNDFTSMLIQCFKRSKNNKPNLCSIK